MDELKIKELIVSIVEREVNIADTKTRYRQPLVGFTKVKKKDFQLLREMVGEHHLLPDNILQHPPDLVGVQAPQQDTVEGGNTP